MTTFFCLFFVVNIIHSRHISTTEWSPSFLCIFHSPKTQRNLTECHPVLLLIAFYSAFVHFAVQCAKCTLSSEKQVQIWSKKILTSKSNAAKKMAMINKTKSSKKSWRTPVFRWWTVTDRELKFLSVQLLKLKCKCKHVLSVGSIKEHSWAWLDHQKRKKSNQKMKNTSVPDSEQ